MTDEERMNYWWRRATKAEYLIDSVDKKIKDLLKTTELWFVPVVNPDGYIATAGHCGDAGNSGRTPPTRQQHRGRLAVAPARPARAAARNQRHLAFKAFHAFFPSKPWFVPS